MPPLATRRFGWPGVTAVAVPGLRTRETKSVDTRGCSRGRHVGTPGGKEPCRRCRRRNGQRWPAVSRHRGFRRFCRVSGGVSGRAGVCRAPRRSRHARRAASWPTTPRGGPGRRRAERCPLAPGLRPVWPSVRSALRPALRALRNRRILPEIPRVLGGSIPPGSIFVGRDPPNDNGPGVIRGRCCFLGQGWGVPPIGGASADRCDADVCPGPCVGHFHPLHVVQPGPGGGSHSTSGLYPPWPVYRAHHRALDHSQSVDEAHSPRSTGLRWR